MEIRIKMKKHKLTGQGGKGSARRNSNEKAYRDNWDEIFGKPRPNVNTRDKGVKNGKPKSI